MFRYSVFSVLIANLIFNVEGYSSIASFVDFVSDPITPEKDVGGNVYEILKLNIGLKLNINKIENILFEMIDSFYFNF